jgi:hypothetical protein
VAMGRPDVGVLGGPVQAALPVVAVPQQAATILFERFIVDRGVALSGAPTALPEGALLIAILIPAAIRAF